MRSVISEREGIPRGQQARIVHVHVALLGLGVAQLHVRELERPAQVDLGAGAAAGTVAVGAVGVQVGTSPLPHASLTLQARQGLNATRILQQADVRPRRELIGLDAPLGR